MAIVLYSGGFLRVLNLSMNISMELQGHERKWRNRIVGMQIGLRQCDDLKLNYFIQLALLNRVLPEPIARVNALDKVFEMCSAFSQVWPVYYMLHFGKRRRLCLITL